MAIKIALAGNPNCGKTTLFNALTGSNQFVGNWPGVTVEKKEGKLKGHKDVTIMDLPGIYSLSPYTLEEVVARNYLINERPDAILNIVDGTNIERNLYLSTQIMELGIPVVTGMYVENPGADMFKDKVYIVPTKNSAAGMRDAVKKLAPLALKIAKGEKIGASCQEGYMPNGVRVNFFEKERGSKRAVKMLLKKLADKPFETEYPMPTFDRVDPQPAIKDLSKATIALCTSGGIVPKGNPDHIESSNASHYGEYDITGVMDLTEETYETAHGGYDPVYANEDPDRVLPVDVMREFEKEGVIGKLHNKFYTTVGNGTAVASAKAFAEEYAQKLIADGVDAVIMTST